ncbi:MAG: LuxR C-terminal-related transcriptional regulator [Comamonas sp.]
MEIAAALGLSERAVENHLRRIRIRKRLGAATTAQAISVAIRNGEIVA